MTLSFPTHVKIESIKNRLDRRRQLTYQYFVVGKAFIGLKLVLKLVTFEVEGFIPSRVQRSPLDLRLESSFLVRKQRHPDVRIAQAIRILGGEISGLNKKAT